MKLADRLLGFANSLRGRLVIVLMSALLLSIGLNTLVFSEDQKRAMRHSLGSVAISRTVSLIRSLENVGTEERTDILEAVDTPFFRPSISKQSLIEPARVERGPLHQSFVDAVGAFNGIALLTFSGGRSTDRAYWEKMGAGAIAEAAWKSQFQRGDGSKRPPPRLQHFLLSSQLEDGPWLNVQATFVPPPRLRFGPSLVTSGLMAIAILLAVTLVFTRMTRSLGRIQKAAERFSRGAEVTRLSTDGPTEVRNVIQAFNTMQERLASFVLDRTRMLASISHDLRTPITAMRLRLELLDDEEAKEKIGAHLDDLQSMTVAALEFAKQGSSSEPLRSVDLTSLIESVADDFEQTGKPVVTHETDRIVFECRSLDIKRMLQNLVANALAYGGSAEISVTRSAGSLAITVDDDGPGIPPNEIESMFKPFSRLETSRNRQTGGSGLGLSIARSIARAHGGDVTLSNRTPKGLRATVRLPINN